MLGSNLILIFHSMKGSSPNAPGAAFPGGGEKRQDTVVPWKEHWIGMQEASSEL